ncbi:MAG: dTDP-4-dehydrorhamnose reductase [Deltaproteobacteria bacterium]|nr:dTDP-4-dehydrorhamnose reductase [Deltaproteobacteria bacterium]
MRLLVTGSAGMLGRAAVRAAAARGHDVAQWDMGEGDLAEEEVAAAAVAGAMPDAVLNCAAFTDVEGCEDPANAEAVRRGNVDLPKYLARACARRDTLIVHVSTDYVFDGTKAGAYVEDDPVAPASAYGRSKLDGERAVVSEAPTTHLILRTAWLYGAGGKNFVDTIRRKLDEEAPLRVVNDQHGCPTYAADLATAMIAAAEHGLTGLYHSVNAGTTTWYGLARKIAELTARADHPIEPCSSADYPVKAKRPANSVLSREKLARHGIVFRPWEAALADYLNPSGSGG